MKQMRNVLRYLMAGGWCLISVLQAQKRVAFLAHDKNSTLRVSVDGAVRSLGDDRRAKDMLRWLPAGDRLSYMVHDDGGGLGRLVVIDLAGHIVSDLPIRRPKPGIKTIETRGIEEAEWLTNRQIRFGGSFNPRNCAIFSFDIESRKESDGHVGACNSFHSSPDGSHIAYLDLQPMGPEWEARDSIMLDKDVQVYPESDIKVLSGPVWSIDSQRIAVLARSFSHGPRTVVLTFSLTGAITAEVEVTGVPETGTDLTWVDGQIAVGEGSSLFIVNPDKGTSLAPTAELAAGVTSIRQRQKPAKVEDDRYRELGAREIAVWKP